MLDTLKKHVHYSKLAMELDIKLVTILLEKALSEELSHDDLNMLAKGLNSEVNQYDVLRLQKLIYSLSESLQESKPVLSAALWGIWDTSDYHQWINPCRFVFTKTKKRIRRDFIHYRALVAIATIQFIDGDAYTLTTSNSHTESGFQKYENNAHRALELIKALKMS